MLPKNTKPLTVDLFKYRHKQIDSGTGEPFFAIYMQEPIGLRGTQMVSIHFAFNGDEAGLGFSNLKFANGRFRRGTIFTAAGSAGHYSKKNQEPNTVSDILHFFTYLP